MEENRQCDGHCERCNMNQRTYCAAQMAYYNQQEIADIKKKVFENNEVWMPTIIDKNHSLSMDMSAEDIEE